MIKEENVAPGGCWRGPFDEDPYWPPIHGILTKPNIILQFKKLHEKAKLPQRNHDTDSGYDIFSVESKIIPANGAAEVETGLQVAHIQPGYWYQISPRSGLGFKHGIQPHLGVIDSTYRGHLSVKLYNFSDVPHQVEVGDRIAQLIVHPLINASISWRDEVEETTRGSKGIGSSGK